MIKAIACIVLVLLCALSGFLAYAWWNDTSEFEGYITRIHWRYEQEIEEYQAVAGECERRNCYPEYSYNHHEDRDCTVVYSGDSLLTRCDTDYQYILNTWVVISKISAANDRTLPEDRPYYPSLDLAREYGTEDCPSDLESYAPDSEMLGCQRAGRQYQNHYITIETTNLVENFSDICRISYGRWIELHFEDRVSGFYYANRNAIECSSLEF